jgi:type VI protein secretion system component VasK
VVVVPIVADLGWRALLAEWLLVGVVAGVLALASWRRTARQRRTAREAAVAKRAARAQREQRRQAKLEAFREANRRAMRRQQRLRGTRPDGPEQTKQSPRR